MAKDELDQHIKDLQNTINLSMKEAIMLFWLKDGTLYSRRNQSVKAA